MLKIKTIYARTLITFLLGIKSHVRKICNKVHVVGSLKKFIMLTLCEMQLGVRLRSVSMQTKLHSFPFRTWAVLFIFSIDSHHSLQACAFYHKLRRLTESDSHPTSLFLHRCHFRHFFEWRNLCIKQAGESLNTKCPRNYIKYLVTYVKYKREKGLNICSRNVRQGKNLTFQWVYMIRPFPHPG